jgi:hypothetical protein
VSCKFQGSHGRQGSQGLALGWILRNRKWQWQWRRASEVAATLDEVFYYVNYVNVNYTQSGLISNGPISKTSKISGFFKQ